MDFGGVGFDGFVGSSNNNEAKQEWYGSGYLKQQGSDTNNGDQDELHKCCKLVKTESVVKSNANGLQQQQMLSFSSSKSESLSSQNAAALPGFVITSSGYHRGSGYNYGSYNSGNMHGFFTEARGPFTPSQWMELEHQALIYKHITANVPIPASLLIPIKRALDSAGFSSYSGGLFRPSTFPWGAFHLGYSSSNDPEPGRCRRTDGKKWRCSRDAVADQKYCERHMNRGRHRSRKHVEGHSGHSAAAATVATTTKLMPSACSSSVSASVVGLHGSGASNSVTVAQSQQQLQNSLPDSSFNLSAAAPLSRMFFCKEDSCERMQDSSNMTLLSSNKIDLKSKDDSFFISKQNSYQESSQIEFGHVNSDSLLNPSHNSSAFIKCGNYSSSQTITDQETHSQHSIDQFVNGWPKSQSDHSTLSLPRLDLQSDRTQLSISIPMAPLDYKSSTSSPNEDKSIISPLSLSRGMDSAKIEMGVKEHRQRQASWIPASWEASIAGPLGEVLHNSNNSGSECKNSSALNLLAEKWDGSPQLGSSPTGVLQKTAFGSLSNSSAGSSPRAENNRTSEGASLCSDLLGSSLIYSSSLPAL